MLWVMGKIPFVGQRFTFAEFEAYLTNVKFSSFVPEYVTLHHTAAPSLAQRPDGFSDQHLKNLLSYYQDQLGWSGGPHIFVDDQPKPIIVFQRLDMRGVHAVSFNKKSWGLEMLGNFDSEDPNSGRGKVVVDNTIKTIALMCKRLKADARSLKFHRDDPQTTKTCPGTKINKQEILSKLAATMGQLVNLKDNWEVRRKGVLIANKNKDGRPICLVRKWLPEGTPLSLTPDKLGVLANLNGKAQTIAIAEIDENGSAWSYVRDLASAEGLVLTIRGSVIQAD